MEELTVETWGEFQRKLEELETELNKAHQSERQGTVAPTLLYRGQENAEWRLETTLERQIRTDGKIPLHKTVEFSAEDYLQMIRSIQGEIEIHTGKNWDAPELSKAKRDLRGGLDRLPPPHYEFMAYLRHHGFPSPFLDWSASPYVAAYFAFKSIAPHVSQVAIYAYSDFEKEPTAKAVDAARIGRVGPTIKAHVRHFSQQSQYTFCRKKRERGAQDWEWIYASHEEAFGRHGEHRSDSLWKITLPASERKNVLSYLQKHKVTGFSLFHSDESLMETLAIREFTLRV